MSTIAGASIYTGAWVDWSRGVVVGSTITLSARSASVLTAFLALFVAIVGSCLWRILSFIIHQCSASPYAKDGLHHQHQLVFRNTSSPFEATKSFAQIAWYWRKNGRRSWARSLPLAFFAMGFLLVFGAASILTSLVTGAAGAQRLIISDDCGYWSYDPGATLEQRTLAMQYKDLNDTLMAAEYARQCYDQDAGLNKLSCSIYANQSIDWTAGETDCPFDKSICAVPSAFRMDTGLVDSHTDLGVNTRQSDRVGFRKVTTCSPLSVEGDFVSVVISTGEDGLGVAGDRIRQYHYGTYAAATYDTNTTYTYNQHAFIDGFGYELNAIQVPLDDIGWLPISQLDPVDADLTIIFLASNAIKYSTPNSDPFFSANFYVELGSWNGVNLSYFSADEFVSVMACADQYQYCSLGDGHAVDRSKCTPLTGYQQAWTALNSTAVNLNGMQYGVASRIALNSRGLSTFHAIGGRGAQALRAQDTISDRVQQVTLPDDQWQVEVSNWFAVSLARLQHALFEYAAPSVAKVDMPVGTYLQVPFDELSRAMCRSQKVSLSGDTVSFSVLGVIIILAVGGAIALLYLLMEPVVGWVQTRLQWGEFRRVRWVMDDKMQVQRMAFEGAGMGGAWTNLDRSVPVTMKKDVVFGDLGGVDFGAPRLGHQGKGTAMMNMVTYDEPTHLFHISQTPVDYKPLPSQGWSREASVDADMPRHLV
ncbi:uncharacterized protein A1O5_03754 [Cladophialophora psammophila CBS 110553]|uniref:Uncharacterized protein n=1 Tax=Cladophialophora psammophila CBS 110553 TaxID=1182543 RepID=W9WXC1_9EURO|nr:uncharacterized protein A1O5_03754 [Cladophialophora psammophila CBS 110553]EXJ72608.1 hypothetical protein A1O5_03754 [Cladophialophora psammophila CBS 110553]